MNQKMKRYEKILEMANKNFERDRREGLHDEDGFGKAYFSDLPIKLKSAYIEEAKHLVDTDNYYVDE